LRIVNAAVRLLVSYADDDAAEARSAKKHQCMDGAVLSMAGGTYKHSMLGGAPMFAADDLHAVTNPTVITEVLSDGTEAFDRGEKFGYYRTLESLREYILVSQYAFCIERFVRNADNSWTLTVFGTGQRVQLASIGCELAVDDVYAGLVLELRPFADTR
jgi:Putative restriction endonuclease